MKISEGDYVRVRTSIHQDFIHYGRVLPEADEFTHEENFYKIEFESGVTGFYGKNDLKKISKEEYLANEVLER